MAVKKAPTRGALISLVWANVFASTVFILIIVFSGQYMHFSFWLASAFVIGLAYLIALLPHRLRFWRYPLIIAGFSMPGIISQAFRIGVEDFYVAALVFLLAIFWLPFIRGWRQPVAN